MQAVDSVRQQLYTAALCTDAIVYHESVPFRRCKRLNLSAAAFLEQLYVEELQLAVALPRTTYTTERGTNGEAGIVCHSVDIGESDPAK